MSFAHCQYSLLTYCESGRILNSQKHTTRRRKAHTKRDASMNAQDHSEYMKGWNLYQFCHSDINVCTSMLQRRGWLDEANFAQLLAVCQFLPGPASSQMGFAIGLFRGGPAYGWRSRY